jgi:hypothetical protein
VSATGVDARRLVHFIAKLTRRLARVEPATPSSGEDPGPR